MESVLNGVTSPEALEVVTSLLGGAMGGSPTTHDLPASDPDAAMDGAGPLGAPVNALMQQFLNGTLVGGNSSSSVALGQIMTALSPFLASFSPLAPFAPLLTVLAPLLTAFYPIIHGLVQQYANNDFFAGSLWLAGFFLGGRFLWFCLSYLWQWLQHRGMVSVCIAPGDEAFTWIQEWLNGLPKLKSSDLVLSTRWDTDEQTGVVADRPRLLFLPKLKAAQRILYKGSYVTFQMRNSPQMDNGGGGDFGELLRNMGKEELVIEAPSRAIVEGVVRAAMEAHLKKREEQKRTSIRRWSCDMNCWQYLGDRPIRPLSSVILDVDTDKLLEDARRFAASSKWYSDRGIPHRRGYLFHGPPGCGKTSLIQALAGELEYDVCVISLSGSTMNDDMLHSAMSDCISHAVFILEDVDAAFSRDRSSSGASKLSFSGLLNAIDGVSAQEGRLLVMTTNHIERLDPALIRPGRIDVRLHLDRASRAQIAKLFLRFYPDAKGGMAEKFAAQFEEKAVSPAALQGYFLMYRDNVEEAMENVGQFLEQERQAREEKEKAKEKKEKDGGKEGSETGEGKSEEEDQEREGEDGDEDGDDLHGEIEEPEGEEDGAGEEEEEEIVEICE